MLVSSSVFFFVRAICTSLLLFSTTINAVENNAKYFSHHQRYILTQEYFEKPIMPVPPLILIWYLGMIVPLIWYLLTRCFKKENDIGKDDYNWSGIFSEFENIVSFL